MAAAPAPSRPLRILSWNVLAFRGHAAGEDPTCRPGPPRPDLPGRLAAAVRAVAPDVLCLQEAPSREAVARLAGDLGWHQAWFAPRWPGDATWPGGFPGAILSPHPILRAVDAVAAHPEWDPALFLRHWGWCEIGLPEGAAIVHTFHLSADWGGRARADTRLEELARMAEVVQAQVAAGGSVVLCADANSRPGSPERETITGWGAADAMAVCGHPRSAPTHAPWGSIDAVWAFPPFAVAACDLLVDPPYGIDAAAGCALSDHFPVLAVLHRPAGAAGAEPHRAADARRGRARPAR